MSQTKALADWRSPGGQPGDLADVIVGLLSLGNTHHEIKKVSKPDFYRALSQLQEEFPDRFPGVVFTGTGEYVYSKSIGDALERALRLGIDVMNPRFYYIGVQEREDAERNLRLIRENTGGSFLEMLEPVANRFAALVKES